MTLILFDIDGTLLDCRGAGRDAMQRAARQLFGIDSLPDVPLAGRTDYAIFGDVLNHLGLQRANYLPLFRRCYLRHLGDILGDQKRAPTVLPGVWSLLSRLSGNPLVQLGLITGNCRPAADLKLRTIGMDRFFSGGGFGDWIDCRTAVARDAIGDCATPGSNTKRNIVIVGDTIHDISCARGVKAYAVAVATGGTPPRVLADAQPDLLLLSLVELNDQSWLGLSAAP